MEGSGDGSSLDRLTGVTVRERGATARGEEGGEEEETLACDAVVLAVGMGALRKIATAPGGLGRYPDIARFADLRGTDVLATRLWLDREVPTPYSASACWGFDERVGMTVFDIKRLQTLDPAVQAHPGAVLECDFYHAGRLLASGDDAALVALAKARLDAVLGPACAAAAVVDAAVVRLPGGVNWYFPGSHRAMPRVRAEVGAGGASVNMAWEPV